MTRLIGPDDAYRGVYLPTGVFQADGLVGKLYADAALTTAADVLAENGSALPTAGGIPYLSVNSDSQWPRFQYPEGVSAVYGSVNGGPATLLRADLDNLPGYAASRNAVPIVPTTVTAATLNDWVFAMDMQRRLLRSGPGSTLQRSADNGATWTTIYTFPRSVNGIRLLDNGELICGIADDFPTNTVKPSAWVSSNYVSGGTLTFTQRVTADDYQQNLELRWGFGGSGGIYAISEYDSKAPGSRTGTQKVWLTTDYFASVSVVYDHGNGSLANRHVHGSTYDPYRDAIWVTLGDYDGTVNGGRSIVVSWNRGSTWTTVSDKYQPTAIYPFPGCVVFGQDNTPNGVLRIDNPSPTNLHVEVAYKVSNYVSPGTNQPALSHVAETPYRAYWIDGAPLLLPFSSGVAGVYSMVLATTDGYTFTEIWRSPTTYTTTSLGAVRAAGPTANNKIVVSGRGESGSNFASYIDAPIPGLTSALAGPGRHLTRATPRRSYFCVANQSSPSFQSVPGSSVWTELLLSTASNGSALIDDADGLFTPSPDGLGVIVARDVLVRIEVDTAMGATFTSPRAAIGINGVRSVNTSGAYIARTMWVRAGQRVSGFGLHAAASPATVSGTSYALTLESVETW